MDVQIMEFGQDFLLTGTVSDGANAPTPINVRLIWSGGRNSLTASGGAVELGIVRTSADDTRITGAVDLKKFDACALASLAVLTSAMQARFGIPSAPH